MNVTKIEAGNSWTVDGVKTTVKSIYLERWERGAFHTTIAIERETETTRKEFTTTVEEMTRWIESIKENA